MYFYHSLGIKKLSFVLFSILSVSILCGNKFSLRQASSIDYLPTHHQVPAPPDFSTNEVLLVSLAHHLGKTNKNVNSSSDLRLETAGQYLILRDANGIVQKSSQINIGWRKTRRQSPLRISRQVIGPFASFESAQRVSELLKNKGIESHIAHPSEWEVWVQNGLAIPAELNSRLFEKEYVFEMQPILLGKIGSIPLVGPISIEAKDGLLWEGGVYLGPFSIRADAYGTWSFLEHVPIERYLNGVVPYEIGRNSPFEALSAQAVLARTWALANRHRFAIDGYHLCSDAQCQVYRDPSQADLQVSKAIKNTARKILTWNSKPIHAVYHATNGGVMAPMQEAWSILPVPYSRMMFDGPKNWIKTINLSLNKEVFLRRFLALEDGAYGDQHYLYRWSRTYNKEEIMNELNSFMPTKNFNLPQNIKVLKRGTSGRVETLEIEGLSEEFPLVLKLDAIRRVLRKLPSTLFVVDEVRKGSWKFTGGGFGHGVGLSQSGAIDLASRGWKVEQILMHYYPGATFETFLPESR